jgi:hypothetical protein
MITGKNKEQFKRWYQNKFGLMPFSFNDLRFEMQIGVYLAYYDSLGVKCYGMGTVQEEWVGTIFLKDSFEECYESDYYDSRNVRCRNFKGRWF